MKKTLALLLTVVLLCTSLFTAIPVFATTENSAPISAIPTANSLSTRFLPILSFLMIRANISLLYS